jgi:hypothetical protein
MKCALGILAGAGSISRNIIVCSALVRFPLIAWRPSRCIYRLGGRKVLELIR